MTPMAMSSSGDVGYIDLRRRIVRELTELIERRGQPDMIVSDNGTGLTSNAVPAWCEALGIEWHYSAPGRPMQNGYVERLQWPHARRAAQ